VVSDLSPLPEARRRAYLDAIGVGLYAARKPLVNALDSWLPPLEVDPGDAVEALQRDGAADGHATAPAARVLDTPPVVVRSADPATVGVARVANQPSAQVSKAASSQVSKQVSALVANTALPLGATGSEGLDIRFPVAVAVFEWQGRYRVLAQLRDGDAPSFDSREHPLWNDLALALSPGVAPAFESLPLFRFPPGRHHRQLATPVHLADALQGLLQSRQGRMPVSAVLVFADAAVRDCLHVGDDTVLLPSLREMLEDWTLKRSAWALMKAVIRH
jgi:hypothetical protein